MAVSDYLLPEKLAPLVRNTIFPGNIFHQEQVESTNSLAMAGAAHEPDIRQIVLRKAQSFWLKNRPWDAVVAATPGIPRGSPVFTAHS